MRGIATRIIPAFALGAALMSAACIHTSPDPEKEARERVRGEGYELALKSGQHVYGELLAVTDTTIVLLVGYRVAVAPRPIVTAIVSGWQLLSTPDGVIPSDDLATLRHRSRFPYGITSVAMTALLRASGQSSPDTLGKATQ